MPILKKTKLKVTNITVKEYLTKAMCVPPKHSGLMIWCCLFAIPIDRKNLVVNYGIHVGQNIKGWR